VSLTEERAICLALELGRSWPEMTGVNPYLQKTRPARCPRTNLTMARRNLCSIIQRHLKLLFRSVVSQIGAAKVTRRCGAYRWSSGTLPRTKPSEAFSYYAGPRQPSEKPGVDKPYIAIR
jgi:hypothetical protein